jgi:HEAT repeat protein
MSAPAQAETIMLLGMRGDTAALPAVSGFLASKDAAVRTASIHALGELGGANEVAELLKQMQSAEFKPAAIEALSRLDAPGVDAALIQQMQDGGLKAEAIPVAEMRNCRVAAPALLKLTTDSDATVRHAAWSGLATLASSSDMDAMMKLVLDIGDPREKAFAEKSIKDFCGQAVDTEKCMAAVIPYYAQASGSTKLFILDIAANVGSDNALGLAKDALKSGDKELYNKAVRSLAAWPNTKASPTLLDLVENAPDETTRILALRGFIQTATYEGNAGKRLKMYEDATKLATRIEEKRLVVSGLGASKNDKAVDLMVRFLDDAEVRNEAEAAALALAKELSKKKPAEAGIIADKIIAVSDNKKNVNTAKDISENATKGGSKRKKKK